MNDTEYLDATEQMIKGRLNPRIRVAPESLRYGEVYHISPRTLWELAFTGNNPQWIIVVSRTQHMVMARVCWVRPDDDIHQRSVYQWKRDVETHPQYTIANIIYLFDPIDPFVFQTEALVPLWRNIILDQVQKLRIDVRASGVIQPRPQGG